MEVDLTNPFPDQRSPKIRISLGKVNPIKEFIINVIPKIGISLGKVSFANKFVINAMANIIKTLGKVDAVKDFMMNGPFDLCAGLPPIPAPQPTQGF